MNQTKSLNRLKREHEIQIVRLCEVTEQKKKVEEDRTMVEEDKMVMGTRLEERISTMQKIINTLMDMMNQLMLTNQEWNHKDVAIANLK